MSELDFTKLRRLNFSLLLVFREVMRHGTAAAAAERLGLSQPAVSHSLRRLRDVVGEPLFIRASHGLHPTRAAVELAPRIEALIRQADQVFAGQEFDPASTTRLFRIAANDFVGSLITAPLVASLGLLAPGAQSSFRFQIGPVAYKALRDGELDVAIGLFQNLPGDLVAQKMFDEDYVVIAKRDHPGISGPLDLETYLRLDHIVVSFVGDLTGTIDGELRRLGLSRRIVAGSPMFLNAFAAVAAGQLVATVPRRLAERFGPSFNLALHAPPFPVAPFTIELIRHQHTLGDPAVDWLIERIFEAI